MFTTRHQDLLCEFPLVVSEHEGAVFLLGPDGIHLVMSAAAAAESAELLRKAAERAMSRP